MYAVSSSLEIVIEVAAVGLHGRNGLGNVLSGEEEYLPPTHMAKTLFIPPRKPPRSFWDDIPIECGQN